MVAPFLTSALDEGKWSASRPGRFTRIERTPGTHWIGGWRLGGLQSWSGRCAEENNLALAGIQPVASYLANICENTSTKALQFTMILHWSVFSLQSNAQTRETFKFGALMSSVNAPKVGSDQ
jgi:hypothetical protein